MSEGPSYNPTTGMPLLGDDGQPMSKCCCPPPEEEPPLPPFEPLTCNTPEDWPDAVVTVDGVEHCGCVRHPDYSVETLLPFMPFAFRVAPTTVTPTAVRYTTFNNNMKPDVDARGYAAGSGTAWGNEDTAGVNSPTYPGCDEVRNGTTLDSKFSAAVSLQCSPPNTFPAFAPTETWTVGTTHVDASDTARARWSLSILWDLTGASTSGMGTAGLFFRQNDITQAWDNQQGHLIDVPNELVAVCDETNSHMARNGTLSWDLVAPGL